jgi:hypothetical protein
MSSVEEVRSYPPHEKVNKKAVLLKTALEATRLLEVIQCEVGDTSAKAICRVTPNAGGSWDGEGGMIHLLLRNEGRWSTHICKNFILKGKAGSSKHEGRLAYCWVISISAPSIEEVFPLFLSHIQAYQAGPPAPVLLAPTPTRKMAPNRIPELTEMPLVGVRGNDINPDRESGVKVTLSNGKPPYRMR